MNLLIVFFIIIVLGPLITNLINKEPFQSHLDSKYYYNDEDCIFNGTCQLPPNNVNFYKHSIPNPNKINKLKCNLGNNRLDNCTNDLTNGYFQNKTCPCQIMNEYKIQNSAVEEFTSTTNSPGLHAELKSPNCPQGFFRTKDNRCKQFCRGCRTGICTDGMCSTSPIWVANPQRLSIPIQRETPTWSQRKIF